MAQSEMNTTAHVSFMARANSFVHSRDGILPRKCSCGGNGGAHGECAQCRKKREAVLHRRAAKSAAPDFAPPIVNEVARSHGQPLDASTRRFMESRFNYDFSRVRIHADDRASRSAREINALAYTVGRDVVFGAGQYKPGTREGNNLLAHELTHTIQQGASAALAEDQLEIVSPNDSTEREAKNVASGKLAQVTSTSPPQVSRQPTGAVDPFANEDKTMRARRLQAIRAAQDAIQNLRNALSRGFVWEFETVTKSGVTVRFNDETFAHREARLRQLMADLALMSSEFQTAPIPSSWFAAEVEFPEKQGGGVLGTLSTDPARKDMKLFYAHRAKGLGKYSSGVFANMHYIETDPVPTPAVARAPASSGVGTGIYINVPDPTNAPLVYYRLTGYEGWQRGLIMEVWSDDVGYYYHGKLGNVYLPRRP
jgi:hypothetical protein